MNEAYDTSISFKERVEYDKLSFYYISLPVILIGQLLGALLLCAMQVSVIDLFSIMIWLALNIIMFLYRFYHYSLFKKESEHAKLKNAVLWLDRYYTNVLLSGIIWGSGAFLLFPESSFLNQVILLLFLFAIGFSALGVLATKSDLLITYVLVMYGPILWRLFSLEGTRYTTIAFAIMSLVLIMMLVANYYGRVINESLVNRQYFIDMKASHDKLKERFFSLFERAPVGIYYYNDALELEDVNREFMKMCKVEGKENVSGISLYDNIDERKIIEAHEKVFDGKTGNYRGPFRLALNYQANVFVDLSTVPMYNSNNEVAGGIAIVNDITSEVTAQEKMMRNAYYDMLTNIPNRTLLMDKLRNLIEAKKTTRVHGALLFLDIDNFKKLNTTLGHDIGDKVIKQVAHKIEEMTGSYETLARIGGDKFVILVPNAGRTEAEAKKRIEEKVAKINSAFTSPMKVSGQDHHLSFSIGAILFSDTKATAFDLLKRAETAMYEAKRTKRGSLEFYEDSMSVQVEEQLTIENDIHKAIRNNEFVMYYQPQLDVSTNKIIGAEALIRWMHPTKGMILPNSFIPLAEESGIIIKLEEWIFDRILQDVKEMTDKMGTFPLKHIAINVSTVHFLEPHFVEKLMLLVKKYDLKPEWFELEITESGIMRNVDDAIQKIKELKGFGLSFSIDDFGTGYSSLSHLKELPVDVIKIDQSFVRDMNEDDEMIVEAVVAIGQKFNLDVLAEGVEKYETLHYLKHIRCNTYQGFLAHTPINLMDFESLLMLAKEEKA
jgi:diguanylate cyclase (GGDEF)-like protein/PAS domain S-box-containing protein